MVHKDSASPPSIGAVSSHQPLHRDSVLFLTWWLDFNFIFLLISALQVALSCAGSWSIFSGSTTLLIFLYFYLFYLGTICETSPRS